jgi:hypothetical protein
MQEKPDRSGRTQAAIAVALFTAAINVFASYILTILDFAYHAVKGYLAS